MGLGDAALVKDNHVAAAGGVGGGGARGASRRRGPAWSIEVECDSVDQVREALAAGARFILLDNMPVPVLREAVAVARGVRRGAARGERRAAAGERARGRARPAWTTCRWGR